MMTFRKSAGMVLGFGGLLAGLILTGIPPALSADIVRNETLTTGEDLFGIDVSSAASPFINNDNYSLTASGDSGNNVQFNAIGIYAGSAVDIQNFGRISLLARGGTADSIGAAFASPDAWGIFTLGAVTNAGNIALTAEGGISSSQTANAESDARASGISAGDVTNSGVITVSAAGGTSTSVSGADSSSWARAYGIESDGSVANEGAISVTARGGYFSNPGDGEAYATVFGILAVGDVSNSGAINLTANGGTGISGTGAAQSFAIAHGIESDGSVTNSGAISVTVRGGTSNGADPDGGDAYAKGWGIYTDGDVSNSGSISVTATGGTATASSSEPYAYAVGLRTEGNIANTGNITATATYGSGAGLHPFATPFGDAHAGAFGIISTGADVTNNADITATASAPETYDTAAVGILFLDDGTLTNTGIIRATADRAYEVGVMSGTVTLGETYNLNLDGDPTVGSLFVNSGATLLLNGADLSVTSVGNGFSMNTEYRIFETEGGTGTVSGNFGGISVLNPNVAVLYHDQSTAGSVDDTVSLSYRPAGSSLLEAADLLRHTVNLTSDIVGQRLVTGFLQDRVATEVPRLYAKADTVFSDVGWQNGPDYNSSFFFTPYFANVDKDADPAGYDADMVGFVTGLERQAKGKRCGFHLGFNHATLDFTGHGYSNDGEDQEVLSAGVHMMGSRHNWTWRHQLTGFYAWHDYRGLTGPAFEVREDADYDSYGVQAALFAGHMFKHRNQILLPEVGVEYLWLHSDGFTTEAENPGWDTHRDSIDEHQVSTVASLRWLTRLQTGELEVTPSLAAGIRYLLTDDELDANQSVAGSGPVTVKADQDDLTGTVSASVRLSRVQLAIEMAYDGEFGEDTVLHVAWLRFHCLF